MTPTTSHPAPKVRARTARLVAAGILALTATLTACSAGDSGASSADMQSESGTGSGVVGADEGGVDTGTVTEEGTDGSVAPAAARATDNRQVVQTGDVAMAVDNPQEAADAIVELTEDAGGRIDDRAEKAATETEVASARLTVRLPAAAVTPTLVALRELGDVQSVDLVKKDVTAAAQDLDARIHAMELSVGRMTNLLAIATTHDDIVTAENALTERETALESLRSQRAGIAEQVSLSTITVALVGPDLPPRVEPVPPPVPPTGPQSFLEGLTTGWGSLVDLMAGVAIVLGVLLPWLAFGGALAALAVAAVRWSRRRRGPVVLQPRVAQPVAAGAGNPFDPPAVAPEPDEHQPR